MPPQLVEGVLHGKVTEASTLPIAGAQINLGYEFGAQTPPPAHHVKFPSEDYESEQNFPNPYDGTTAFRFNLLKPARVYLRVLPRIYAANVVATAVNQDLPAGSHSVLWDSMLSDSTLLTNGSHLVLMQVLESNFVVFEDERPLFHNSVDPARVARMKPSASTDLNGDFSILHGSTSIGDTLAFTSADGPEVLSGRVVTDSVTIFVSRAGYKTATRRVKFDEDDEVTVDVVLERL